MTAKRAEERLGKRAKEIAREGRHIGWWYVASELSLKDGEPLAMQILEREPLRSEIDRICDTATQKKWAEER